MQSIPSLMQSVGLTGDFYKNMCLYKCFGLNWTHLIPRADFYIASLGRLHIALCKQYQITLERSWDRTFMDKSVIALFVPLPGVTFDISRVYND